MTQTGKTVDPLRKMHCKVKAAVMKEFTKILPNKTKDIIKKLSKGSTSTFAKNYSELTVDERSADDVLKFEELANEKLDELMTFGGSEESHENDVGKSKMVSFAPAKAGKDGGSDYDKAWTINANACIKSDMARRRQLKTLVLVTNAWLKRLKVYMSTTPLFRLSPLHRGHAAVPPQRRWQPRRADLRLHPGEDRRGIMYCLFLTRV